MPIGTYDKSVRNGVFMFESVLFKSRTDSLRNSVWFRLTENGGFGSEIGMKVENNVCISSGQSISDFGSSAKSISE
jgi:hypothetical protein